MGEGPVWPNPMAGIAMRILLQIVLVFRLRLPEWSRRFYFRDRLARPDTRSIYVGNGIFCYPLLLFVGIEDSRAITGSPVIPLPVQRSGIMDLKEKLQQL